MSKPTITVYLSTRVEINSAKNGLGQALLVLPTLGNPNIYIFKEEDKAHHNWEGHYLYNKTESSIMKYTYIKAENYPSVEEMQHAVAGYVEENL